MAEIYTYSSFSDKKEEEIYNDSGERIGLIVDLNTMKKKTKEDSETYYKKLTENYFDSAFGVELSKDYQLNMSKRYTQLAKEGKFNELPSTCEFSEPVKLLVSNLYSSGKKEALIIGKLKDRFFEANFQNWQMANTIQEPTEHKVGDVVEVETEKFGVFFGMIHTINQRGVIISFGKQSGTLRMITDVKSIKKIK